MLMLLVPNETHEDFVWLLLPVPDSRRRTVLLAAIAI
jgi:hypothetical protein